MLHNLNQLIHNTIKSMNAREQLTSAKYGSNLAASMVYNKGLPQSATIGSLYHYSYSFDAKFGWPNSRTNNKHSLTENFGYENLRLDSIWGNSHANNGFAYENSGNLTRKNDLGLMEYDGYRLTDLYAKTANLVPVDSQMINYTWFHQIKNIAEGDYSASFTYNSDQQRCKMVVSQNGSTQYTRWYPGSRYMKEVNGSATTQYTWLGGDAYTAPAVSVKVGTGAPVIYYVLRDYLGSITHIVKSTDLTYQAYSFDAWGRRRSADDWSYTLDVNDQALFAGRGFTGHSLSREERNGKHLPEFGLINMNGRLYDPLLGRFLSPDNNVQLPDFSQNFNRYSYALNNPLAYTDPDGEFIFSLFLPGIGTLLDAACWGAVIGGAGYTASVAMSNGGFSNWNSGDFWKSVGFGAASGFLTAGVGQIFGPIGSAGFGGEIGRALTHGVSQAWLSGITGYGDPMTSFASAGLGSLAGSAFMMYGRRFASSTFGNYAFSGLAGGIGAELTGGNFWQGAATGLMTTGLNHLQQNIQMSQMDKLLAERISDAALAERQRNIYNLSVMDDPYGEFDQNINVEINVKGAKGFIKGAPIGIGDKSVSADIFYKSSRIIS